MTDPHRAAQPSPQPSPQATPTTSTTSTGLAGDRVMVDGRSGSADEARLPLDPHLLRADGCFETALVVPEGQGHRVLALDLHLARLCSSLESLRLFADTAALAATLRAEVARLLAEAGAPAERVLRVTVTPGLRLLELRRLPERVLLRRGGVTLHPLAEPRTDGLTTRHKTLAWSTHAAAIRQHPRASDPRFEGVWLTVDDLLLEGTATNLLILRAGEAATPPTHRPILPGTARARTLAALSDLGFEVRERDVEARELLSADAVLATSSLLLAAPALSYRDEALGLPTQPLLDSLLARLRA